MDRVLHAAIAITGCEWIKLRECGELLYGKRFPPKLKGADARPMYGQQFCIDVKHAA